MVIALTALVVLPVVVTVARAWGDYTPFGDDAVLAVRASDVVGPDSPTLGMPSGSGAWTGIPSHHPGPLLFWAYAPFVEILGPGPGLLVAVAALVTASVLACVLVSRRLAGPAVAAVVAGGLGLVYWSVGGPEILYKPLNPIAAVFPFMAFLFLSWAVAERQRWALPWWVLSGSLAVQADLAYLVGVGVVGAVAVALARPSPGAVRRLAADPWGRWSGAAAALVWAPVALDLLRGSDSNAWQLARSATSGIAVQGADAGVGVVRLVAQFPFARIGRLLEAGDVTAGWGPLSLAAAVGGVVVLGRVIVRPPPGAAWARTLATVTLAAVLAAAVSAYAIPVAAGFSANYYYWMAAVAAMAWVVVAAIVLARQRRTVVTAVAVAVAVAALVVGLVAVRWPVTDDEWQAWAYDALPPLADDVDRALPPEGTFEVVDTGGYHYRGLLNGLFAQLDDRGHDLVTATLANYYGDDRSARDRAAEIDGTIWVGPAGLAHPPERAEVLAHYEPPEWDEDAVEALAGDVAGFVERSGGARIGGSPYDLGLVLIGREAGICPVDSDQVTGCAVSQDLAEVPDLADTLTPRTILDLYRDGRIASPALPADLQRRLDEEYEAQAVTVWLGPAIRS